MDSVVYDIEYIFYLYLGIFGIFLSDCRRVKPQTERLILNWRKKFSWIVTTDGCDCYNGSVFFMQAHIMHGVLSTHTGKHNHIQGNNG